jgi:diacylglycerol kinase family enzyme
LRAFDATAAAATAAGSPGGVDFVVALGGDGTVLRAASLLT